MRLALAADSPDHLTHLLVRRFQGLDHRAVDVVPAEVITQWPARTFPRSTSARRIDVLHKVLPDEKNLRQPPGAIDAIDEPPSAGQPKLAEATHDPASESKADTVIGLELDEAVVQVIEKPPCLGSKRPIRYRELLEADQTPSRGGREDRRSAGAGQELLRLGAPTSGSLPRFVQPLASCRNKFSAIRLFDPLTQFTSFIWMRRPEHRVRQGSQLARPGREGTGELCRR